MKKTYLLLPIIIILSLAGCNGNLVYSHYQPIPEEGWHKDSAYHFVFDITDSTALYEVDLLVRHGNDYHYQNLWLFLDEESNEVVQRDSVNLFLADDYGRWRGSGIGSISDISFLYKDSVHLPVGTYHFFIKQGMRQEWLSGISEIGLQILKK